MGFKGFRVHPPYRGATITPRITGFWGPPCTGWEQVWGKTAGSPWDERLSTLSELHGKKTTKHPNLKGAV